MRHASELNLRDWRATLQRFSAAAQAKFAEANGAEGAKGAKGAARVLVFLGQGFYTCRRPKGKTALSCWKGVVRFHVCEE